MQNEIRILIPSHSATPGDGPLLEIDEEVVAALNQAISNGQILWDLAGTSVLDLGSSVAVKIGRSFDVDHITTLQYIKGYDPNFPAPETLGLIETDQQTYLFMYRAPGVSLDHEWSKLVPSQKTAIQQQLNVIFRTVRTIPCPHASTWPTIGDVSARCKDTRKTERVAAVELKNEVEFNDFLCSEPGRTKTPWIRMVRSFMRDDHATVFTHGDLHPRNIMVTWGSTTAIGDKSSVLNPQQDIRITSILDWEMSGWYLDYWEFVKALNTIGPRGPLFDWCDYLPTDAIGSWPTEYAIDLLISRWLG